MASQHVRKRKRRFTGWRKAALTNTIFLSLSAVLLLGFLAAAIARSAGLNSTLIFFRGDCATSNAIDLGLHLLLNAFSTGVLASSNFFIQVLNAPSRQETDVAHAKGRFLDIGVGSWRNAFNKGGGWGKTVGWVVLLASSVPIHLIFNSVVFDTDYRETEFKLAIATEGFVMGEEYYWPGASLAINGLGNMLDCRKSDDPSILCELKGYGETLGRGRPLVQVMDDRPATLDRLEFNDTWLITNVSHAAAEGKNWVRLAKEDCVREYLTQCRGLTKYGNLIVVVDPTVSGRWAREDVWDLNSTAAELWESMVPARRANSLWYAANCETETKGTETDNPRCFNTCWRALGATIYPHDLPDGNTEEWTIDFFPDENDISRSYGTGKEWVKGYPWLWSSSSNVSEFGLRSGRDELRVDYCLAEPFHGQCSVGLSNQLLLAVAVCVLVKAYTCTVVIISMREQEPLVTLGDAIQSFISKPDPTTVASDYVYPDFRSHGKEGRAKGKKYGPVAGGSGPIQWQNKPQRGYSFTPWHSWLSLVLVMVLGYSSFAILKTVELGSGHMTSNAFRNLFTETSHDSDTANGYVQQSSIEMILLVNIPQIVISIWYLTYNQLLTRLVMAREWARFSSGTPQPLRVTYPRGQQVSTYFLSLPYRYSVPLLITSIITHWLVSRTVYVFVSAGSYYMDGISTMVRVKGFDPNLPESSALQLRYSMTAHITVLLICTVMAVMLVGFSLRTVSSSKNTRMVMPPVGTSSRAIAAACHVSPLSKPERVVDEYQVFNAGTETDTGAFNGESQLLEVGTEENHKSSAAHVREVVGKNLKNNTSFTIKPLKNWTFGPRKNTGIHIWADDEDLEGSVEAGLDSEKVRLARICRSLLVWGIVEMPRDWYARNRMDNLDDGVGNAGEDAEVQVVHMSFGTQLDRVTAPEEGRWYLFR
ncbi:hypothetical protein V8F20_002971 [Naviculisporaceae sp. PSN 640]